ncbi:hypothetical protein GCM10010435_51010 [Winogradskya consettensis]|uniref:Peptidoglycan binding domain-containing protein n=1 Tax=Winogradskya consettensis TaxID=113560 RepID=A0A919SJE5_9ACTN|nr:hypothetical protein [Actinoplanes consettensis]GIM72053.1 hypothetical protein Aco04nite_28420 [Actinoplanes consettensis]
MRTPFRMVAVIAAIALTTGAGGWMAASRLRSPADAAAARRAPEASLVTVPVERRLLTSQVVTQGSVTYGKARQITLTGTVAAADGGSGSQLVTKASASGRTLREGDVLLEINGRPVFVLKGTVPMYRTLTLGSEGDDVRQVRAALRRLLPDRGLARSGAVNDSMLDAVRALYQGAGYAAVEPTTEQRNRLRELERAVTGAEGQPLKDARNDLADFRKTYGVSIASGEIVFLPRLPLRVTSVSAKAGNPVSGAVATVADPALVVNATVATEDAELLRTGLPATLQDEDGGESAATVTAIGAAGGEGTPIILTPRDRSGAGRSVKVSIEVGRTSGEVLAVPVAAVFTASDGQARVTVADSAGIRRDVPVEPGLAAGGDVEVTPVGGATLTAGERVVVSGS